MEGELAARDRPDDVERLFPGCHRVRQRLIRWIVRDVTLACEKSHEWPPLMGDVLPYRSPQHGITTFERVQERALRRRRADVQLNVAVDLRQRTQMRRQDDPNHRKV